MNKKNAIILLFATALCLAFLIPSASAGGHRYNSGFVVVYGYPQTYFFSSYVFGWPSYYVSHHYRQHPRYRSPIYHQPPHHKHYRYRDDRDERGHRRR